jgi:hypothetical protein
MNALNLPEFEVIGTQQNDNDILHIILNIKKRVNFFTQLLLLFYNTPCLSANSLKLYIGLSGLE